MSGLSAVEQFKKRLRGANRIVWSASDVDRIAKRFGLTDRTVQSAMPAFPSAKEFIYRAGPGANDFDFSCTISTAGVDRMGDTIAVTGWQLGSYRKNPVVLFGHASDELPVGRAASVWIAGDRLRASVKLAPATANPLAEQARQLVAGGFLSSTSVGFKPLEWSFSKDPNRPYGIDFKRQELLEFSLVPIPANPEATIDATVSNSKGNNSELLLQRRRELAALKRGAVR